jgi:hemolysin III
MVDNYPAAVGASDGALGGPAKPRLRGVSHEVAAVVFPFMGLVALLVARSAADRLAVAIYTVGVTGMYATSACYHRGNWRPLAAGRMRRLDHSMILVAIASTYTPVTVVGLSGTTGWALLSLVWGLAIAGVVVRNLWLHARWWVAGAVYVGVGWTALAVLPAMWTDLGVTTFVLVLTGGLVYSVGALVLNSHRPDPVPAVFGYHEVFHALVIVAGLLFYTVVFRVVTRA